MAALRVMLAEARQAMTRSLADAAAAVAARRQEDEAAIKRLSAEIDARAIDAAGKLRGVMAEERELFTAAVAVKVAEAVAGIDNEKAVRAGRRRLWRPLGDLGPALAVRGRAAAAWAALLALSVIAGLALLWVLGRFGPGHGGR